MQWSNCLKKIDGNVQNSGEQFSKVTTDLKIRKVAKTSIANSSALNACGCLKSVRYVFVSVDLYVGKGAKKEEKN